MSEGSTYATFVGGFVPQNVIFDKFVLLLSEM
jgi:hypothetical protein